MITLDRIRLTGLLTESPANAGLSHFRARRSTRESIAVIAYESNE
jgi:hypothetical protein